MKRCGVPIKLGRIMHILRQEVGGYSQSEKVLEVNLFVQPVNLNGWWMRKPVAVLRGNAYRIQQLMNLRYNFNEEDE